MTNKRTRTIQWIALLGSAFIATQIATILFSGEAFCLNQGCNIVESFTTIPPIYFNLAGFIYFLAVFGASLFSRQQIQPTINWLRLLLLSGLAGEGVLVSYQLFVIQTTCVYCLLIFALIVLLNVIYGRHQLLLGTPVFLAGIIAFSSLNFSSAQILIQAQNLESGTFAVKRHDNQAEPLFLFFSSDCPHCRNVLDTLDGDNNCQISFNPIDRIDSLDVPGIEYFPNYNPTINRLLLSLLDIKTIPVLLDKNGKGLTFIKGEEAIVDFINKTCFDKQLPPQAGSSSYNAPIGFSAFPAPEGECEIEVECPDLVEGQSTSDAN